MKIFVVFSIFLFLQNCGSTKPAAPASNTPASNSQAVSAEPSPLPTSIIPKDGDYPATGLVTNVNTEAGWVEIDHGDIKDMMPPMKMMFNVKDKAVLKGIKTGDKVDFVLEYKHPTEIVKSIKKIS
jgi:Cu(I)/Ag(I) efflux system periplasmic protein CusF